MQTTFPAKNLLYAYDSGQFQDENAERVKSMLTAIKEHVPNIDEAEVKRKGRSRPPEKIEDGERAVIRWVSTRDIDREKEIVVPSGIVLDDFKIAPVVLLNHDYSAPPIGIDEWIYSDGYGLKAKTKYATTDRAEEIYRLNVEGVMRTSSIGFIPLEWVRNGGAGWDEVTRRLAEEWGEKPSIFKDVWLIYTKTLLLEHSDVSVPANIHATNIMTGKGLKLYGEDLVPVPPTDEAPDVRAIITVPIDIKAVDVKPISVKVIGQAPKVSAENLKRLIDDEVKTLQGRLD